MERQDRHDVRHDHQRRDDEEAVADRRLRVDGGAVNREQGVENDRGQDEEDLERGDREASCSCCCSGVDGGGLVGVGGEGEEEVGRGRGEGGEGGLEKVSCFFFFFWIGSS